MFHFFMSSHIETSVRSIVAIMTLKHFLLTYIQSSFIYLSYLLPPLSAICLQISGYKIKSRCYCSCSCSCSWAWAWAWACSRACSCSWAQPYSCSCSWAWASILLNLVIFFSVIKTVDTYLKFPKQEKGSWKHYTKPLIIINGFVT